MEIVNIRLSKKNKKMKRTNNPNGRPHKPADEKKVRVSFRLHPDAVRRIREQAELMGVSQAAVIEQLVL